MNTSRYLAVAVLITGLAMLPSSGFAAQTNPENENDSRVVARVNSRPIYYSQLKSAIDTAKGRYKKFGGTGVPEETSRKLLSEELERQIAVELLRQAGEKVAGERVDKKLSEAGGGTSGGAHAAVASSGDPLSRERIRSQMLIDEYVAARGAKDISIPDDELIAYYKQNSTNFKEPESVRVSHILYKIPAAASAGEVEKIRKEIGTLRAEIIAGKGFEEAARQKSTCSSATKGGDLGYIKPNYMPREFDAVAFSMSPGSVSDVVRTRHGFHLIKVFDKKPERIPDLGELKDFIEKHLKREAQKKKIDEIVRELRRTASVEVLL